MKLMLLQYTQAAPDYYGTNANFSLSGIIGNQQAMGRKL
jgi:hypothetical protein